MSQDRKKLKQLLEAAVPSADVEVLMDPKKFGIKDAADWATFQLKLTYPNSSIRRATSPQFEIRVTNDVEYSEYVVDVFVRGIKNDKTGKGLRAALQKAGLDVKGKRSPKFHYDATKTFKSLSSISLKLSRLAKSFAKMFASAYGINEKAFLPSGPKKIERKTPEKVRKNPNPPKVVAPGVLVEFEIKQQRRSGSGLGVVLNETGGKKHWAIKVLEYKSYRGDDQTGKQWRIPKTRVDVYTGHISDRLHEEVARAMKSDTYAARDRKRDEEYNVGYKVGDYVVIRFNSKYGGKVYHTSKVTKVLPGKLQVLNPFPWQKKRVKTYNMSSIRPATQNEVESYERNLARY